MNNIYFGKGECYTESDFSYIDIIFRGSIVITSKLPKCYLLNVIENKITIRPFLRDYNLKELFHYKGSFEIISATGLYSTSGEAKSTRIESLKVKKNLDFPNLIKTHIEDITININDMNSGFTYLTPINKTRVRSKIYNKLHTSDFDRDFYLKGKLYEGSMHLHLNGNVMTGEAHSANSMKLETAILTHPLRETM